MHGSGVAANEVSVYVIHLYVHLVLLRLLCSHGSCFVLQETRAPKKLKFVVDDNCDEHDADDGDGEVDEVKEELFDSVCAYCDDGGEILWYAVFSMSIILFNIIWRASRHVGLFLCCCSLQPISDTFCPYTSFHESVLPLFPSLSLPILQDNFKI